VVCVTHRFGPLRRGCELRLTHTNVPASRANEIENRWTGILYGLGETLDEPLGEEPSKEAMSDASAG